MRILFFIIPLFVFLPACKKAVEIDQPINEIQSTVIFSSDSTAQSAVTGLYASMMQFNGFMMNGGSSIYGGLAADELKPNSNSADYEGYYAAALTSMHGSIGTRFWQVAYSGIYHANQVIEGLQASTKVSPALGQQLLGEAMFVRAFYYFQLVNFFGEVPLVLTSDYRVNSTMPRTDSARVYAQIVSDLKVAKILLPANYISTGRVRPNQHAAAALLARVYVYQQQWTKAVEESSFVLQSTQFALTSNLNNVFTIASPEVIWQLMPGTAQANSAEGAIFIPFSATTVPQLSLTPALFSSFENSDGRKTAWVKSVTVNAVNYTYPFKYKVRSGTSTEYNVVLRLAEQVLIRAEAYAQLQQIALAKNDLDRIRLRAGLPPNNSPDANSLLDAIQRERRIELFSEWGHRWFDLKRTGKVSITLAPLKPGWSDWRQRFPIQQQELDRNIFLVQNTGY